MKRIISHIHTGKLTESSVIKFIQYIKEQILIITEIIVKNPKRPEVKISKSITIPISKNRNESRFGEIFVAVKLSLLFFMEANNLMVVNSTDGQSSEILGKFLYYSFPRLLINKKEFKELVERYGFPASKREKHSAIDAFRCATTDVKDRIVEERNGEPNIARIYFRDNKRVSGNIISRELVEETVNEETNDYRKLANVQLDRNSGDIFVTDVDCFTRRDVDGYCDKVKELYKLYLDSVGNRQIETVADKYISSLNAIKISARGYHFFIPKQYMGYIDDFEDFMEELSGMNLYAPTNKATRKEISINSMYVADDEKQRKKMATEFYLYMQKQIQDYQDKIEKLIKAGSQSNAILTRWLNRVSTLEDKKYDYEVILKQRLNDMDSEFECLRTLCDEYKLRVRAKGGYNIAA